jgi:hypothetical protein
VKGSTAVAVMQSLRPFMGDKRQGQITRAIESIQSPLTRITFHQAAEIRRRRDSREPYAAIARDYDGVDAEYARAVCRGIVMTKDRSLRPEPWMALSPHWSHFNAMPAVGKHHWLAGILEGEGSFSFGSSGSPSVGMTTTCADVAMRVSSLLGGVIHEKEPRQAHWSLCYQTQVQGALAYGLMQTLRPLMGERRREQIAVAIKATESRLSF